MIKIIIINQQWIKHMNLDTIMIMPLDMLLFFLSFRTNLLIDLFLIYLSVMHTKCSTVLMVLHTAKSRAAVDKLFNFFTKFQGFFAGRSWTTFSPNLSNIICCKKGSPPEAQLEFHIISLPKDIDVQRRHFYWSVHPLCPHRTLSELICRFISGFPKQK